MEWVHSTSIAAIAGSWNHLANDLYSRPEWLASYERAGVDREYAMTLGTSAPGLGVVMDKAIGTSSIFDDPARLLHVDPIDLSPHLKPDERQRLDDARAVSRESWTPNLAGVVSVLPGAFLPGILRGDATSDALAEKAVDFLEARAQEAGAHSTAVAHVPVGDRTLRDVLDQRGYSSFACVADCVLHTPWESFDEYLAAMTNSKRSSARRKIRDFTAKGAVLVDADPATLGEQHARLVTTHMAKYGHAVTLQESQQILETIAYHLRDFVRLLEVRGDGRLVAFLVYHAAQDTLYPKLLGFSEDADEVAPYAYFQLLFYGMVERAVTGGFRRVVLSPESYRAKALHGCRYEPRVCYVKFRHRSSEATDQIASLLDSAYRRRLESQPWSPL
jgi:uncharacterized protein